MKLFSRLKCTRRPRIPGFSFVWLLLCSPFLFKAMDLVLFRPIADVHDLPDTRLQPEAIPDRLPRLRNVTVKQNRPVLVTTKKAKDGCSKLKRPLSLVEQRFQRIAGSDSLVYSAFQDGPRLRLIVVRQQRNETGPYYCQVWYGKPGQGVATVKVVKATFKDIPRSQNTTYTGSQFLCYLPKGGPTSTPFAVSITMSQCGKASNALPVRENPKRMTSELTVCVPPIHHALNEFRFMVESIELKRILGIHRFVFYNYSVGKDLEKILLHYKSQGIVDIIDWPLPLNCSDANPEIYYYGQHTAANDCLYRYRHLSKYIIFQDVDEFFIPQGNLSNVSQLIDFRLKAQPKASSFQIRNAFFPSVWPRGKASDAKADDEPVTLRQTHREDYVFPYNKKAKCIVDPRRVTTVGIHQVIYGDTNMDKVPTSDALMYHYRLRAKSWRPDDGIEDTTVVDKYGQLLRKRLKKAWSLISKSRVLLS